MEHHWDTLLTVFLSDIKKHRIFTVAMFVMISLAMLGLGLVWPKYYESATIVLVDDSNIIRPLMEGTAVTTDVRDRAKIARDVIFSRKIMDQTLRVGGWLKDEPSAIKKEALIEGIKTRLSIEGGRDLIRIRYRDSDAQRAFKVTGTFADLFIAESIYQKIKESQDALDFIDKRAQEYHAKLLEAEQELKVFRTENPGIRPGSEREVGTRIDALKVSIDSTHLDLRELEIQRDSLREKLTGEANLTADYSRQKQYAERLTDLRTTLDTLRLSYTDEYPDIISLKSQIAEVEKAIVDDQRSRDERGPSTVDAETDLAASLTNPLYQELRSQLTTTETQIATSKSRIFETEKLLTQELDEARQVHIMEAKLLELRRDYDVNSDLYKDLTRRRENARVSNNLDREEQGLTFKIHEPAFLPLTPGGVRFLHFMLAGVLLGIGIPLGLIYVKIMMDPRVRFKETIADQLDLPVLVGIPHYQSPRERRLNIVNVAGLGTVVTATLGVYVLVGYLRYTGKL